MRLKKRALSWLMTVVMLISLFPTTVKAGAAQLAIVTQPENVTWEVGETASFSVSATGENLTYQWQVKQVGKNDFSNSGSASAKTANYVFTMQNGHKGMQVRCVVTDASGASVTSETATCVEAPTLAIVSQPENVNWEVGKTASFAVSATGENLSYQWQVKQVGKNDFSNSGAASAKTANYMFTMQSGHKGMQVRCVVTDASGASVTSETATCVEAPTLAILSQPQNVTWKAGTTASFTVEAAGEGLTYQWQVKQVGKSDFSNSGAASAMTANYTFTMQNAHKGMQVRCVVTDATGASVTSETATCVEAPTLAIVSQPENVTWKVGTTASFTVEAAGEGLTYQWQVKQVGKSDFSNSGAASAKTANYTFTMQNAHKGMQVRCVVTDASGASVTSETAMCVEAPALAIVSQPEDVTWEVGKTASFAVSATGENLSYQWQVKQVGKNDFSNSGAASAKTANYMFTMQSGHKGMQVRCVVTDANGASVTSEIATCVERQVLAIVSQPENVMWKAGTTASFEVEAVGEGLTYQWQVKQVGKNDFSNSGSASAKTANYTFTMQNGHKGMQVRCVVTDASGASVTSEAATCVEPPSLAIVSQPVDQMWAVGQVASFEIVAIGEELTYQWQVKMSGREDFVNSSANAAKTANYRFTMQNAHKGMEVRCVVTDKNGNSVTSDVAFVSDHPVYTVTYDAGLGMFPATKQKTYVVTAEPGPYYLDNYGEDMVPVLDGYEFHGWLYQGKFVEQVNLTSNIVLTPMWVQVFDLVFDANGGHFPDATTQAVTTKTIKVGPGTHRLDNVMDEPIPDPIRNGYVFVGWLYNNKIVKKVKITDASVTVVAQWETAYQVTYDANGGTMSWWDKQQDEEIMGAQYVTTVPAGPYYVYDAPRPWRMDATTNEYYEFECWTQTVNGKDVRVDDCINLSANLTLKASYAKWVRITYDANGGEFDDGSTTKEDGAHSGPFTAYWVTDGDGRNVSCDNCSFLGWSTQANATTGDNNFDAFLTEDTTYYAVWSEKPVITYDANGGYFYHKDVYDQNGQQVFDDHGNPMKEAVTIERRGMELGEGKVDGFGVNFDGPYQFIGWSTSAKATTATYQPGDPITITGSIWLYAVFKQMPTIIYDANGGGWGHYEPIPSATEGGDATEQFVIDDYFKMHWDNAGFYYYVGCDSPERPGYEFLGWYTTSGEDGLKADDDELILAEGATYYYYAHWAKRVTITYVTNEPNTGWGWWDYQYNENEVRSIVFEQTSFTRDTIAGSDYKIDGWRPDAADSPAKFLGYTTNPKGTIVEYEVDDPIELTDDITLYAVWVQNPTIHYVCDEKDAGWNGFWDDVDGDGEEEYIVETQERLDWRNLGEHEYYVYYVGFEAPERPGYEFDHWVDDQGVNADDRALTLHDGDVYTFHATWRKIVTVTYTTNIGGWGWFDNDAPEGEKYEYVEFNNYDRNWGDVWTGEYHVDGWTPNCCDGPYEFVGYATDEDATEATLQPGQKITLTDDTTFFAIWKQLPTIIYDGNGGGWGEYDEDEDTYEESTKLDWRTPGHYYHVRYEQPYRENYDFDGWVDAQDVPKDDVALLLADGDVYTFKAKWIPHVTIVYDANGGEFDGWESDEGESSIRHIRHERGGEYWLDGWHPNREGYDFGGWSLTPENQQKVTEPYNLTQDTMFYAIWDELLTVTYDANGGVWYDGAEDPATGEYQTVTLTQQQQTDVHRGRYDVGYGEWPEREGYEFIGWAPTFDSQEASEWWTTEINGNTTFYAIWEKLMVVTYDAGDGYFWYDEQNKQYETTWTQYAKRNEIIRVNDWAEGEPEREGYRFDGWLYNGDALRWVRASQNITFTVDWVKTYEVQLVANGGYFNSYDEYYYEGSFDTWQDGEDYVFYKQQCDDGEGYDFFNGGFPIPQRDGYTFIGWSYPSDNDENLVYAVNVVINGADMELFAQWEPIPDYEPEMISANDYQ